MVLVEQAGISIDLLALGVSLIAITLSVISLMYRNSFYKKSLRPILNFSINSSPDKKNLSIVLSNKGTGPALIEDFFYSTDKGKSNFNQIQDFRSQIHAIFDELSSYYGKQIDYKLFLGPYNSDGVLSPSDSKTVFKIEIENPRGDIFDFALQNLRQVEVKCSYKSVYDIEYSCKSSVDRFLN